MHILVTGGAGYIGSHAVVELLRRDYKVVIVDNFSNSSHKSIDMIKKISKKDLSVLDADIRNFEALDDIFFKNSIDAVMHFAGLKSVGNSIKNPLDYYDNNVYGSLQLLKAMTKHSIKKIIFSSSATVYGNPLGLPINETMIGNKPINPYGMCKLMTENILEDWQNTHSDFITILLRYFNPVGAHSSGMIGESPKDKPNNLMPLICNAAHDKKHMLKIYGNNYNTPDGTGIRDYIHISDLVMGHIVALEKCLEPGNYIYNLGTGKGISVLELLKTFEKVNNVKINYDFESRRDGDVASCYADPSKINKELGWFAEYGTEKMCKDAWKWKKSNPKGF